MARPKKETATADGATRARVLVACAFGECDDVVELSADELKQGVAMGWVDPDPGAVAYADSLKG